MNRFNEAFEALLRRSRGGDQNDNVGDGLTHEANLLRDTALAQLLDPDFAADAVQFVVLEVGRGRVQAGLG